MSQRSQFDWQAGDEDGNWETIARESGDVRRRRLGWVWAVVLAAILESFVHPFTIMFTLPLGLVGVSAALVLSGATINIMSLMAIVMLVGIVVNNAILILDLAGRLRKEGKDAREAIFEAASRRFRAIVMTTLAIIAGIFPQAVGGSGAAYTVAMAVVTMGGVIAAGSLSLFIIPVVYTWFDRFSRA